LRLPGRIFALVLSTWLGCAAAAGSDVLRDRDLVMRLLRHGEVDLGSDVARELPRAHSELQIRRIGLRLDGHRIRAAFRDKSRLVPRSRSINVRYLDAWYNEVAAYVVARALGLDMVPPTVLRKIGISQSGLRPSTTMREGSLQLWIENAVVEYDLQDDRQRYPGDPAIKYRQLSEIHVFDCIIGNVDRHAGNILIDLNPRYPDQAIDPGAEPLLGKLWAIDHGRAFHRSARIDVESCKLKGLANRPLSRDFMEGMRDWSGERVARALEDAGMSGKQIDSLHLQALERRLKNVRARLEDLRRESGLSDAAFYSSGIWHRVR
jgi:hypothetical protein